MELEGSRVLDISRLPMSPESASARLSSLVSVDGAFLAARFDSTEVESYLLRIRSEELGLTKELPWGAITLTYPRSVDASFLGLGTQSGLYPPDTSKEVFKFLGLYSASDEEVNPLGNWLAGESLLMGNTSPHGTSLQGLEPSLVTNLWTKSLERKKVVAIRQH